MSKPTLYMIAGPNGAGKTTAAMKLLPNFLSVHEFVNADEIARGLNPLNADGQAVTAGRLMLQRIDSLIVSKKSFAFETTASSRTFADKLNQAKKAGYVTCLIFLWLPDAEYAKRRVWQRVQEGGHNIPENVIERRYKRGLYNLVDLYLPLVDWAVIIDNTTLIAGTDSIIATKIDDFLNIDKHDTWRRVSQTAEESKHE